MTKQEIIGVLNRRAELQVRIQEFDKLEIDGESMFCMGNTGNEIHVTEEAFYKIVEILQPSIIRYTPNYTKDYTYMEFDIELNGMPFTVFGMHKYETL